MHLGNLRLIKILMIRLRILHRWLTKRLKYRDKRLLLLYTCRTIGAKT